LDAIDRLADILTVRADVLDRRRAGESGDAGKAFDARQSAIDGQGDEVVPRLACGHDREVIAKVDAAEIDADHEAVEAGVGDQQIAPSAEDEDALWGDVRASRRSSTVVTRAKKTRRPSDAEGW